MSTRCKNHLRRAAGVRIIIEGWGLCLPCRCAEEERFLQLDGFMMARGYFVFQEQLYKHGVANNMARL